MEKAKEYIQSCNVKEVEEFIHFCFDELKERQITEYINALAKIRNENQYEKNR